MPPEISPESHELNIFTEQTDIYSFGILLMLLYNKSTENEVDIIQKAKTIPKCLVKPEHASEDT